MNPEELITELTADRFFQQEIRTVAGVELEQARVMHNYYVGARKRIVQQLVFWSGTDRFTEARLEQTLEIIDNVLFDLESYLNQEVRTGSEMLLRESQDHVYRDLEKIEKKFGGLSEIPIRPSALVVTEADNFLINQYSSSMKRYNQELRGRIQRELGEMVIARSTAHQATRAVEGVMNQDLWKVSRIVRTELHNIYSKGKLIKMQNVKDEHIPDLKKGLIHPIDHRTAEDSLKLADLNPIVDLNEPFRYSYKGKVREFMTPPDRPNDRAVIVPIRGGHIN